MRRGDIDLVSVDAKEGREQRGHRPQLVVSLAEFNDATRLPVILPITAGGEFARRIGFAVAISGIKTTGVGRCEQPRVPDIHARNGRKVDTLPQAILDLALAKVATIFESALRIAGGMQAELQAASVVGAHRHLHRRQGKTGDLPVSITPEGLPPAGMGSMKIPGVLRPACRPGRLPPAPSSVPTPPGIFMLPI